MKYAVCALAGALVAAANTAAAHTRAIDLLDFDQASGYGPWSGVVADKHGTLFGTNSGGGNGPCDGGAGCGTIYSLKRPGTQGQPWTLDVLYDFQNQGDGWFPEAPVTLGPHGSLFGYPAAGSFGKVFQLVPANESWSYNVIYNFTNGSDGNLLDVIAPLVWSGKALYGIASGGVNGCGQEGCGSVFRLMPPPAGSGSWTEKTLFSFSGKTTGGEPSSIVAAGKTLFVATDFGSGAVVEIAPAGHGSWAETVLTRFNGGDDGNAPAHLVIAGDGTIFGTAQQSAGGGLIFELSQSNGNWTRTDIAQISYHGYGPDSLALGPDGSLIGAVEGDVDYYAGGIFRLTSSGGSWSAQQIWNFNRGPDRNPEGVVMGLHNRLYGTLNGGDSDGGAVFELK